MAGEKVKKHKGTHKAAFPIGLIIALLALIGLAAVIVLISTGIKNLTAKNKDYTQYNKLLTPVVLIDPSGFDDITKADMSELIEMSVWAILKSDISPDTYSVTEGGIVIPEADVNEQFKKLFGTEVTPVHATIEGYDYEFAYDADAKAYTIPITSVVPIYTPKVIEKEESADTIVLTVALIAGEAWQQAFDGSMVEPDPDKYIKVTLRVKDGEQFISAIQSTTTPETATTLTPAEEPTENQDLLDKADVAATESTAPETQNVTDENGENVTDEDGNNVTETVAEKGTEDESTAEESSAAQ
ncbi:MAG: hypothetical protein J1F24_03445 [Oscillospiraceae bacterium]|nr:hypothetical protein [Oscillospiraceae bacterium]